MINAEVNTQPRLAKLGWGILLVVSALLVLNGLGWFFAGPNSSLSSMAENTGVTVIEFEQAYPSAATSITANARLVALWFMAFGLLALIVALEGFRRGTRWAWNATWVLVATITAVGLGELPGVFGIALLGVAAMTLLGQLLARTGLSSRNRTTA
jgi:hypothetical protein